MRMIGRDGVTELEIRKSRFICALARVHTEDEATAFIAARRREHRTATHNCTAYVLGDLADISKSNDDGEPSGTAGVPMMEVLHRRDLTNIVAVVTRYFGGIKLGAGGLVRAYGQSVAAAIDDVGVVERVPFHTVLVTVDHTRAGRFTADLHSRGMTLGETTYGAGVTTEVRVPVEDFEAFMDWVAEVTAGQAEVEMGDGGYLEVAVGLD